MSEAAESAPSSAAVPQAGGDAGPSSASTGPPHLQLYDFWRSGSSWRVRIALHLKDLPFTRHPVNLTTGEHMGADYGRINPAHTVPTLVVSYEETQQQFLLSQSTAILEWLEETHPQPPLLPKDANGRARVRELVGLVAADTQPLANSSVLQHIQQLKGGEEEEKRKWGTSTPPHTSALHPAAASPAAHLLPSVAPPHCSAAHYITRGLTALEARLRFFAGRYCYGDAVTMADLCLVPQLYSARRFGVPLDDFPVCRRVEAELSGLAAFKAAHAEAQTDNPALKKEG